VPSEDGVGRHDRRDPLEQLPAKPLPLRREPAALIVVEAKPLAVQLVEDSVLFEEVVDRLRLLAVDPGGEREEQESKGEEVWHRV